MVELLPDGDTFPKTKTLGDRVHMVLGMNPSIFTGPGTNTFLVGAEGDGLLLIDTGSGAPEYIELLQSYLKSLGAPLINRILLTHNHPDHIGGVPDLLGLFPGISVHKFPLPGQDESYPFPIQPIADGDEFQVGQSRLRVYHTPGHALDHVCFYLENDGILFTGDVVLGKGTTVLFRQGGGLTRYLKSLRLLDSLNSQRIFPGHGPVVENPHQKIQEYLKHRLEREKKILGELEGGAKTVEEIVAIIYSEYPSSLYPAAEQSVLSHLDKLAEEGIVLSDNSHPPRYARER